MDREGVFHPLGLRQVRRAGEPQPGQPRQQSLAQLLWIFQPGGVSSPRSTGPFPARARTSGW
jgi:hypothetical protein